MRGVRSTLSRRLGHLGGEPRAAPPRPDVLRGARPGDRLLGPLPRGREPGEAARLPGVPLLDRLGQGRAHPRAVLGRGARPLSATGRYHRGGRHGAGRHADALRLAPARRGSGRPARTRVPRLVRSVRRAGPRRPRRHGPLLDHDQRAERAPLRLPEAVLARSVRLAAGPASRIRRRREHARHRRGDPQPVPRQPRRAASPSATAPAASAAWSRPTATTSACRIASSTCRSR